MATLAELSGRNLIQSLGLGQALQQRDTEQKFLLQEELKRREREKQEELERKLERKAGKKGLFETIGTVLGAAGGFIVGGPQGAAIGSKLGKGAGSLLSGESGPAAERGQTAISQGADLLSQFQSLKASRGEAAEKKELDILKNFEQVSGPGAGITEQTIGGEKKFFRKLKEKSFEVKLSEAQAIIEAKTKAKEKALTTEAKEGFQGTFKTLDKLQKAVPPKGRLSGFARKGKALFGKDPAASALDDFTAATGSLVARQIFREKGTLTDQDIARSNRILPKATDSPGERDIKMSVLESLSNPALTQEQAENLVNNSLRRIELDSDDSSNEFNSVQEAKAANLPKGTIVFINGRPARI